MPIRSDYGSSAEQEEQDLKLAEQQQELPANIEEKRRTGKLKTGYTTGTSAAAATKASAFSLNLRQGCRQCYCLTAKRRYCQIKSCMDKSRGK